jgi:Leucine-rich repeat (LRR) protein
LFGGIITAPPSDRVANALSSSASSAHSTNSEADGVKVTEMGVLQAVPSLGGLEELSLNDVPLTDAGLKALALPKVAILGLNGCGVTDAGVAAVAKLPSLASLFLSGCPVTDAGLAALQAAPKLTYVTLNGTKVTKAGVEALKKAKPDLAVLE